MRQEQTQTSFRAEAAVRKAFDEMNGTGDGVRAPYHAVSEWLGTQPLDGLKQKLLEAETMFRRTGITFAVYGSEEAAERLIPFDIIPRIISAAEWQRLTAGIEQRVRALNAFMYDIYHRQEIIRAGRVPVDLDWATKSRFLLRTYVTPAGRANPNSPVRIDRTWTASLTFGAAWGDARASADGTTRRQIPSATARAFARRVRRPRSTPGRRVGARAASRGIGIDGFGLRRPFRGTGHTPHRAVKSAERQPHDSRAVPRGFSRQIEPSGFTSSPGKLSPARRT